jgi:poly(3-hydroxybutyrate) depolymerase
MMIRLLLLQAVVVLCMHAAAQKELRDKKDIAYAWDLRNYDGSRVDTLRFDIYYPTGATSNKIYPVYFSLHGGSFQTSTKKSVTDFSDALADQGFVVVALTYRVGYYSSSEQCPPGDDSTNLQEAVYRAIQDVNACMRYVTNRASTYNIDTNWVFMGGSSAGGTLTLNTAYVNDSVAAVHYPKSVATWGKLQNSGNKEPYRYTIKGICPMWGGVPGYDNMINSKSAIPTILFKGGKDASLPEGVGYYMNCPSKMVVRAGSGIYDQMKALQKPCVYHFGPIATHTAYDDAFCIESASCFFKALMSKRPYSGYFEYYNKSCR